MKPGSLNFSNLIGAGMGFEMEEMLKQVEMGLDTQKNFAKMNEDRNVEDGV